MMLYFRRILTVNALIVFALNNIAPESLGQSTSKTAPQIDQLILPNSEPTPKDWQRFHQLNWAKKKQIWYYFARKGYEFNAWKWQWRIAWVRSCQHNFSKDKNFCLGVFHKATQDKALVVRSEAASAIGYCYQGSGHAKIIKLLQNLFQDPRNSRNGKPLFIQKRILYALHLIGGPTARNQAKSLVTNHKELALYWKKLDKSPTYR